MPRNFTTYDRKGNGSDQALTSISKNFSECNLRSGEVIEALKAVLDQTLRNWEHWCQVYKTLTLRTYDANENDTIVAFHSLLVVAAHLMSASHVASVLLFSHANIIGTS